MSALKILHSVAPHLIQDDSHTALDRMPRTVHWDYTPFGTVPFLSVSPAPQHPPIYFCRVRPLLFIFSIAMVSLFPGIVNFYILYIRDTIHIRLDFFRTNISSQHKAHLRVFVFQELHKIFLCDHSAIHKT